MSAQSFHMSFISYSLSCNLFSSFLVRMHSEFWSHVASVLHHVSFVSPLSLSSVHPFSIASLLLFSHCSICSHPPVLSDGLPCLVIPLVPLYRHYLASSSLELIVFRALSLRPTCFPLLSFEVIFYLQYLFSSSNQSQPNFPSTTWGDAGNEELQDGTGTSVLFWRVLTATADGFAVGPVSFVFYILFKNINAKLNNKLNILMIHSNCKQIANRLLNCLWIWYKNDLFINIHIYYIWLQNPQTVWSCLPCLCWMEPLRLEACRLKPWNSTALKCEIPAPVSFSAAAQKKSKTNRWFLIVVFE